MYIETARLIIRNFESNDSENLFEILGDAETMKNSEPPYDFEKTKSFLHSFCIQRSGAVAAVHKQSDKLIGYILFNEQYKGIYEMGWFFNRAFWRQGYAFESCKAVINYAFEELNVHKIFAETIDNMKSVNLMKKLGMQLENVQPGNVKDAHGNWVDLYLYSISK